MHLVNEIKPPTQVAQRCNSVNKFTDSMSASIPRLKSTWFQLFRPHCRHPAQMPSTSRTLIPLDILTLHQALEWSFWWDTCDNIAPCICCFFFLLSLWGHWVLLPFLTPASQILRKFGHIGPVCIIYGNFRCSVAGLAWQKRKLVTTPGNSEL